MDNNHEQRVLTSKAPVALAIIAVAFSLITVTISSSTGVSIGVSLISPFMNGTGTAYTAYAFLWDLFFVLAAALVLVAVVRGGSTARKLVLAGLCSGLAIVVLNAIFGVIAISSGLSALKTFSLLEYLIIVKQSNVLSLLLQFIVYGGALGVYIVATKSKSAMGKAALIGYGIVAIVGLVLLIAGFEPYAYSIGGGSFFGYSIPQDSSYFVNEFASNVCMWFSIALFLAQRGKSV